MGGLVYVFKKDWVDNKGLAISYFQISYVQGVHDI